jgi:hypothetical protein
MATAEGRSSKPTLPVHGALVLPSVIFDAYNCELEDDEGLVGDKASKSAFHEILDRIRKASDMIRSARRRARRSVRKNSEKS